MPVCIYFMLGPCLWFVVDDMMKLNLGSHMIWNVHYVLYEWDDIHPVLTTDLTHFPVNGPFVPFLRVSLCSYCESAVQKKTVCIPWTRIGKLSASILGCLMHRWLIFHMRARSTEDIVRIKGCLLNVWCLLKAKSFRFTSCFHNLNLQHEVLCIGKYT